LAPLPECVNVHAHSKYACLQLVGSRSFLMQIDEAALVDGRPIPPKGCPGVMGTRCPGKVQRRGAYHTKSGEMPTFCFRCALCRKHDTVKPTGQLPHRTQSVDQVAQCIDSSLDTTDQRKECPTERRRRQRVFHAFEGQRMLLAALFSLDLDSDTKEVWKHIKERYGNVQRLVEELHRIGLSLTGIYRCLRPWWVESGHHWARSP
jgi:hypothetical protein